MLHKALIEFPVLTTERLTLRQLSETDVKEIFLLRSDPVINKYLGRKPSENLEDALRFIRNIKSNDFLYWAVTETSNGQLIGTICLFDFSDDLSSCETGYELLTGYQGQGIMHEAMEQVIAFGFHRLGLKTIDAVTHKDNLSSTKLLEKFNFAKTEIVDEGNGDLVLYRLS